MADSRLRRPGPVLPRFVWRTMRKDMRDLDPTTPPVGSENWKLPIEELHKGHDYMRQLVMHCITDGSREFSMLLPACTTIEAGIRWNHRSDVNHRDDCGWFVRIDTEKVGQENIIDMSTHDAQLWFYDHSPDPWPEYVRTHMAMSFTRSQANKECLIMWRGRVPLEAMTIFDTDGYEQGPLAEALLKAFFEGQGGNLLSSCLHRWYEDEVRMKAVYDWFLQRAAERRTIRRIIGPQPRVIHPSPRPKDRGNRSPRRQRRWLILSSCRSFLHPGGE